MSDPEHPQPGPPWYITKNCNVAHDSDNIGYCQQAKSGFACTIILMFVAQLLLHRDTVRTATNSCRSTRAIFAVQLVLAIMSCFPTDEIRAKQEDRRERHEALEELKSLKSPVYPTYGLQSVMTPRTNAFNQLNGTMNAPLQHPSSQNTSPNSTPDLKDPDAIEVVHPAPVVQHVTAQAQEQQFAQTQQPQYVPELQHLRQPQQTEMQPQTQPTMYFPPPPKKAKKSKK